MSLPLYDARAMTGAVDSEYDVCIVGTGAAGVTVASQMRRSGYRICVLEGGGLKPDPVSDSALELEWSGLPVDEHSRERYFGGTTNTWWGKLAMLDEVDLAERSWVPLSGWPITSSELLPYYERASEVFGIGDLRALSPSRFETKRRGVFDGALATKSFFWTRTPLNFASVYRRALAGADNVDTWLHANVAEILLDEDGTRVRGVEVLTPAGRRVVRARTIVLACGGIENARLLLASNGRHPRGVGNAYDQVGRYYMDHPKGDAGSVANPPRGAALPTPAYWSGKRAGPVRVLLGVGLAPAAQREHGALNSYVLLHPVYPAAVTRAARSFVRRKARALADPRLVGSLIAAAPDLARYVFFKRYGMGSVPSIQISNFMEQPPMATNRVTLSGRRDALGRPLAAVHWEIGEAEKRTMRALHRVLADEFRRRGDADLTSPLLTEDDDWLIKQDSSHHMGTTRMGVSPRKSVVDRHGAVHGVAGLYLAGSSVFPTSGSANPTMTIVALAARLADHLSRSDPIRPGASVSANGYTSTAGKPWRDAEDGYREGIPR